MSLKELAAWVLAITLFFSVIWFHFFAVKNTANQPNPNRESTFDFISQKL